MCVNGACWIYCLSCCYREVNSRKKDVSTIGDDNGLVYGISIHISMQRENITFWYSSLHLNTRLMRWATCIGETRTTAQFCLILWCRSCSCPGASATNFRYRYILCILLRDVNIKQWRDAIAESNITLSRYSVHIWNFLPRKGQRW